jgi:hypothetical protein
MSSLPKLPEPATVTVLHEIPYYTKSQMIAFQAATVEACAAVCEGQYHAINSPDEYASAQWCAEAIRAMLKEIE